MLDANEEVLEFYNNGAEIGRLERGIGRIEYERTKEIILRYLPKERAVIYDVGGGAVNPRLTFIEPNLR